MSEKSSPNWLLHGFILVSIGVHAFFIVHSTGIYQDRSVSYIELSLDQTSRPDIRVIPKPRLRHIDPRVADVKAIQVKAFQAPRIQVETVQQPQDSNDLPDLPQLPDKMDVSGLSGVASRLSGLVNAGNAEAQVQYTSEKEYFEMLNRRVQRFKEYPESAKSSHIEGKVHVQFVLLKDGTLSDIKILKSSRHKKLDEAAVQALIKASPFPKPPDFLFKGPVTMRINILFELA